MDSESLIKEGSSRELNGISVLQQNSPDYHPIKPKERIEEERQIRHDLRLQGVDLEIIKAIQGYKPEEIPFIYRDQPSEVEYHFHRGAEPHSMQALSELWIGTTDEIWNLVNKNGWTDQIPEVLAQWRGHQDLEKREKKEVTRTEIHHLSSGAFIELEYREVSEMGQFDGKLSGIELYTPKEKFRPYGGNERNSYDITSITNRREVDVEGVPGGRKVVEESRPEWQMGGGLGHVTGTSMLNGLGELLWPKDLPLLQSVKWDPEKRHRFSKLPALKKRDVPLLPPSQAALVELQKDLEPTEDLGVLLNYAQEIMTKMFSEIKPRINSKSYQEGALGDELDGVLNHPDKIWLLDKYLDEVDRKTRFGLTMALTDTFKNGKMSDWIENVFLKSESLQGDLITRNARHLVLWLKRSNFKYKGMKPALEKTKHVLFEQNGKADENDHKTYEILRRSGAGLGSSLVEKYLEYMAQQYLGNYLEN